jgi:AcrR family transcriptional regulator
VTPGPVAGQAATVGGLLLQSARRWPDADALVEGQTVLTHGQAWERAQTVAARLAARNVRPGDRIGLFMPNGWRYAVAYYGIQLAGAVAVLVNTRFTAPEIDYVLTDSGADFVVVDAALAPRVPQSCAHWDADELTAPGRQSDELPGLAAASTDTANILYTSGTTGYPNSASECEPMNAVMQTGRMPPARDAAEPERSSPAGRPMPDYILSSAATLFSRRGYHAVGIRELADAVGLSTSTLYHYYPTKQDILFAVISRFLHEFTERLVAGLRDGSVPPRQRLERAVTDHVVLTVTRREELLAGNPVLNALTAEQQAHIAALRRGYRDAVRDVIAEGAAAGQFHVADPLLTAMAMLDMLDGIRSWYHEGGALSLTALAARYRTLALALCQAGDDA